MSMRSKFRDLFIFGIISLSFVCGVTNAERDEVNEHEHWQEMESKQSHAGVDAEQKKEQMRAVVYSIDTQ